MPACSQNERRSAALVAACRLAEQVALLHPCWHAPIPRGISLPRSACPELLVCAAAESRARLLGPAVSSARCSLQRVGCM